MNYNFRWIYGTVINRSAPYTVQHMITMRLNDDLCTSTSHPAQKPSEFRLPGWVEMSFRILDYQNALPNR
nr:hypothetical protein [Micromonospora sp. RP3T]